MFGLFRKKKGAGREPVDPLATFDQVIDCVERQGAELRKSAATLLTVKGQLDRDKVRYEARVQDVSARIDKAAASGDAKAEKTLRNDAREAQRLLEQTTAALEKVQADGALLLGAAQAVATKLAELKEERVSAKARMSGDAAVSQALKQQLEQFDQVLALDAARDEVERAHALAQLYRDDQKERG